MENITETFDVGSLVFEFDEAAWLAGEPEFSARILIIGIRDEEKRQLVATDGTLIPFGATNILPSNYEYPIECVVWTKKGKKKLVELGYEM